MKSLSECRLYCLVDTAYLHGRAPEVGAQQLCDGGADLIQLRAKNSSPDEIRRMAEAIAPITKRAGVNLVINDHLEIARDVGAEFCHLGQEDFFDGGFTHVSQLTQTDRAREPLTRPSATLSPSDGVRGGSQVLIGLSTHAPEQAKRAMAAEPAYIAIGPVYATGTKPTAKPVTLKYVRWAAENVSLPWFAIGGINLQTLDEVLATGATRVCVVSAILNAPDIARACAKFRKRLA